jgi:hypothetical protein
VARGDRNVLISGVSRSKIRINYQNESRFVPLEPAVMAVGANVTAPARLLKARAGVIPYIAHRQLVDDLEAWCHRPGPFATCLVGGRGGAGKTRLGVELCSRLGECDWLTGLLTKLADRQELEALVRVQTCRLVVIDYAETRVETIASLLPLLATHASEKNPVRVLLLVRAAPRRSDDWIEALRGHSEGLDLIADQMDTRVLTDQPFDLDVRRQLFTAAAAALRPRVGGMLPDPLQDLESTVFATPLTVVAAAYLALVDPDRQPTTRSELFDGLLEHEDRYWASTGPHTPDNPQLRRRVVALATLTAARSEEEAAELVGLVPNLGQEAARERRYQLAGWAHALYHGPGWWNPVEPDLLGEHLVASTYRDHPDVLAGVLSDRSDDGALRAIEVYSRLAADRPLFAAVLGRVVTAALGDLCSRAIAQAARESDRAVLLGTTSLASALVRLVTAVPPDPEALAEILDRFPFRSDLMVNSLAVVLRAQIADWYRSLAEATPAAWLPDLAMSLNNLSNCLADAGRREEGLAAIEEALGIRRSLAEANPAAWLPDLAMSLNNLSNRLADAGRWEEGLAAIEEAVGIRRRLAEANPAAWLPDLAMSLNNLSNRLADAGRWEEGLAAIEEAVGIRRRLAEANPAAWFPDLAASLNNLSVRLADAGRREEALGVIEEAVGVYRTLAEANPAAWLPDLAMSLNNLSNCLADAGRREEGLAAIEEAVGIRRSLAEANPAAWLPDLAMSLNNLSNRLADAGRREEGLAAIEEAVGVYRSLAEANPAAWLRDLAASLNNLSVDLGDAGRRDEALAAVEEAVGVYRSLAEANPAAYLPALAGSLNNLSVDLGDAEPPGRGPGRHRGGRRDPSQPGGSQPRRPPARPGHVAQ